MTKIYGERWRTIGTLGEGGQSVVYRVVDTSGEHQGEYALKRVLSTLRTDRFVAEVRAGLTLSHPNIIPIVDHSLLSDTTGKKYIVSPIAAGKDLSKRVGLYRQVLDSTLVVAQGLCRALGHAHAHSIIHRDVKPENILFASETTHEPWLCDFGICLYTDVPSRITQENERVGSAYFMAPELEAGGVLDVTPAADVYSVGKVIYYMITGGKVMPREKVFDVTTSDWDAKGPRHQLLRNLLGKTICSLPRRIANITEVTAELERIRTWEDTIVGSPVSIAAKSDVAGLKEAKLKADQIRERNREARSREIARVQTIAKHFCGWLEHQLEQARRELEDPDVLVVQVRDLVHPPGSVIVTPIDQQYSIIGGREISLTVPNVPFKREHVLEVCSM